ncbi:MULTISPECIES: substrate-binding domain-containing protein [unclassified Nostoc]|uniref:substrate-binding domain-containing protein n=1 Tax=unclassified Nostoc TaxID=2593658 RepID=UPI002AD3EF47|nr:MULTISPECIES: substrate-binding domain-containing protein [unclassified Nostoc]MDZ8120807.1 substrate-binding domain-containing protein [Nostoc sp. CmiVER01]MDZ8228257.1 substrate-binding domain-containing protein [Nostoc sp. ChiVER01]
MKLDVNLCNNLKSIRTRLGMSQQELANIAGVTRQSIGGVELGQYAPSVAMSLRLAKALGCQVEDLFWFEEDLPEVEAILAGSVPKQQRSRVSLARVGDQWIAYPLVGNDAFRIEMIPADGETVAVSQETAESVRVKEFPCISKLPLASALRLPSVTEVASNKAHSEDEAQNQIGTNKVQVRLLDDMDKLHNTVVIAGCTPVLSLLARATERWHPKLRIHYRFAHSGAALRSLCRGEVHIAGMHLYDADTGEHNIPFVRKALTDKSAILITLGVWEEGLLVPPGNPMGVKKVSDLVEFGATIVTHEVGSGSRMLLERKLQEEGVPLHKVKGSDHIVHSHQDVALSVVSGIADAGISTASIATAFGLGFIPLHRARYDLVIIKEYLEEEPVKQFLSILGHQLVRSQLEILGGYDTSNIGEVVANIS